jgi:hypothetical protein
MRRPWPTKGCCANGGGGGKYCAFFGWMFRNGNIWARWAIVNFARIIPLKELLLLWFLLPSLSLVPCGLNGQTPFAKLEWYFSVGGSVVLFLPVCGDEIRTSVLVINNYQTSRSNPPSYDYLCDVTTRVLAIFYSACIFLTLKRKLSRNLAKLTWFIPPHTGS